MKPTKTAENIISIDLNTSHNSLSRIREQQMQENPECLTENVTQISYNISQPMIFSECIKKSSDI